MGVPESSGKPFDISKRDVWDAWLKVKENQGAPGVDAQSIAEFEKGLKNNCYKVWNRMSSGSYFPLPVRAVEIAKPHGDGVRTLGIPTVADRIAQTVVAKHLEGRVEQGKGLPRHGGERDLEQVERVACRGSPDADKGWWPPRSWAMTAAATSVTQPVSATLRCLPLTLVARRRRIRSRGRRRP